MLAFGDLDGGAWGAAWIPDGAAPILALAAGSDADTRPATLAADADTGEWRLEAEGAQLVISPLAELEAADRPGLGSDQLCRVTGQLGGGEAREVDCLGWRADRELALEEDRIDSLRLLSAWFAADEAVALLALRPHKARGQDADLISVAVREARARGPISDPRLSTTYADDGRPMRAGLELWIAMAPNPEDEEQAEHQLPRRLAGEALGTRIDWAVDGLSLHAALFRWHERDRAGAGVYLLGVRQ